MRFFLVPVLFGILHGQSALLRLADSLSVYGKSTEALALYDSVLHLSALPESLRLQAYVGRLRPLLALRRFSEVYACADSVERLAVWLRDTLWYGAALSARSEALARQNRYSEAEGYINQALEILKNKYIETPVYATTLHRLGFIMHYRGRYSEAEKAFKAAAQLRALVLGTEHPDYTNTLNNLAAVYRSQGRYREAEELYLAVKEIRARILGTEHLDYATTLNNLANVYADQGRYSEAEKLYLEVMSIRARILGTEHPLYANTLNNIAVLYERLGKYPEAERFYLAAKSTREKINDTETPEYANLLNNLAEFYKIQGRYADAEKLYTEAQMIQARILGKDHPDYATTLGNLAIVYRAQGRYLEAEKLLLQVIDIRSRRLGVEHIDYTIALNNLANLYQDLGRYSEAERLFTEVKSTRLNTLGMRHPYYAITLNNLAVLYEAMGKYADAEELYKESGALQAQTIGTDHPNYYLQTAYNLALLYMKQGRYAEADPLWDDIVRKIFSRMSRDFLTMPTVHRQQLLQNLLWSRLMDYQRYVAVRGKQKLVEQGYRLARSVKGILLSSTEAMKWLIETKRSDTTLQRLYESWCQLSEQYAAFALREDYTTADSLWEQAALVEKTLIQRLPELKAFFPDPEREPLLPPLRRGEVAIEVVRVFGGKGDSLMYLFYIVEGGKKAVRLYVHQVDTLWEKKALASYEILRSPGSVLTCSSYRLLWGFIDSLLPKTTKVIYFSPDGVYYRVNVASLYDGRGFVIDRYDIRHIATTRRLLIQRPKLPPNKPVVIGNPDFRASEVVLLEKRERTYRSFPSGIPPLPGAEEEAQAIARLLDTEPVIGSAATEEYVKNLRSPQVLHIATHGYFLDLGKSSMLESGILLAQAALWDSLYPPVGVEDGRLTAQEASALNLLGTDLVVLSACETGLGETGGEGIYGLQRAFLEAGAGRVITALWQIDDKATRVFMEMFYQNWLKVMKSKSDYPIINQMNHKKMGSIIDEAFMQITRDFRHRYPEPYYWGAFLLMR